jgi:hypothetical protein
VGRGKGYSRCRVFPLCPAAPSEGADPIAYIASVNVERRQLTKGQQAMAYAMLHPKAGNKGGRGNKNPFMAKGFSAVLLSKAYTVLAEARDLAPEVMLGRLPLEEAYHQVLTRRRQRQGASDLADQVLEETISLDAARPTTARQTIEAGRAAAVQIEKFCAKAGTLCAAVQTAVALGEHVGDHTRARLQAAMTLLDQFRQVGKKAERAEPGDQAGKKARAMKPKARPSKADRAVKRFQADRRAELAIEAAMREAEGKRAWRLYNAYEAEEAGRRDRAMPRPTRARPLV